MKDIEHQSPENSAEDHAAAASTEDFFWQLIEVTTSCFFSNIGHHKFLQMDPDELFDFAIANDIPPSWVATVRAAVQRRYITLQSQQTTMRKS
jgi:hypothetical protein